MSSTFGFENGQDYKPEDNKSININIHTETLKQTEANENPSVGIKINLNETCNNSDNSKVILPENAGFTNALSGAGMQNLKRIDEGKEPVIDTRYVENTEGYSEKFKHENLDELLNEFNTDEKYKRRGIFGGIKDDSKEMKAIRKDLTALTNIITNNSIFLTDSEMINSIFDIYRLVIENCNTYLGVSSKGHSKVGKARKSMVERIRTTAMRELNLLPEIIESEKKYQKQNGVDKSVSWIDLIRKARSVELGGGENDSNFEVVGQGASTVVKMKSEGQTYYFKEDDTLKEVNEKNLTNTYNDEFSMLVSTKTLKPLEASNVQHEVEDLIKHSYKDLKDKNVTTYMQEFLFRKMKTFTAVDQSILEDYKNANDKEEKKQVLELFIRKKIKTISSGPAMIAALNEYLLEEKTDFVNCFSDIIRKVVEAKIDNKEDMVKAYEQSLNIISRTCNSIEVLAKQVKLPKGAKITTNNVATSRMANLLKISDLVAKSKSAIININGKTLVGNMMEEAKGQKVGDIYTEDQSEKEFIKIQMASYNDYLENNAIAQERLSYLKQNQKSVLKILKEKKIEFKGKVKLKDLYDGIKNVPDYKNYPLLKSFVKNYNSYKSKSDMNKKIESDFKDKFKGDTAKDMERLRKILNVKESEEPSFAEYCNAYGKVKEKLVDSDSNYTRYLSGNVKKQMIQLGILDFIMGQTDRNNTNFLVQTDTIDGKKVVVGIKAIDNDCCCGLLKSKEINSEKNHDGHFTKLKKDNGDINIPYIDSEFAQNILNLEIETITYEFIDLLSTEQIKAIGERLEFVKDLIRKELSKVDKGEESTMKFISGNEWDDVGKNEKDKDMLFSFNRNFFNEAIATMTKDEVI